MNKKQKGRMRSTRHLSRCKKKRRRKNRTNPRVRSYHIGREEYYLTRRNSTTRIPLSYEDWKKREYPDM